MNDKVLDKEQIPSIYAAVLSQVADKLGGQEFHLGDQVGISSNKLYSNEGRVSRRQFGRMIDLGYKLTDCPSLGLEFGRQITVHADGLLSQLVVSANTLGEAVDRMMKYYPISGFSMQQSVTVMDDLTIIRVTYPYYNRIKPQHKVFTAEAVFASHWMKLQSMLGDQMMLSQLNLAFGRRKYLKDYEDLFGCDVSFDQQFNEMVFPTALLSQPLKTANPFLSELAKKLCDQRIRDLSEQDTLPNQVKLILQRNTGNIPSLNDLADSFELSPKALRQRLARHDTSYQNIVNSVLKEKACHFLGDHRLSVDDVASRLGYSDSANFRRAFKRWTGKAPSEYRRC
ncbi:AraC family transcriptional regulator [Litoribrevibacter euphylliae]|uniref:AraC family transcriptional regulator n=1 Tax=Litoribrevibacter euphylliae TaxID=1834034 RepID=A0ABV7HBV4_9GAMM